jgi:prepilin-type processing-associated H-X9-DG protein
MAMSMMGLWISLMALACCMANAIRTKSPSTSKCSLTSAMRRASGWQSTMVKAGHLEARRHLGRFNVVFIDSHVEASQPERLFEMSDENMSRWNMDHQPHREELRYWGE